MNVMNEIIRTRVKDGMIEKDNEVEVDQRIDIGIIIEPGVKPARKNPTNDDADTTKTVLMPTVSM